MAIKKQVEAPSANIENLIGLRKEFMSGKMIPRKTEMLKIRLLELHKAKAANSAESELLETMLKRDRARGELSDEKGHVEILNRIEHERCTERCRGRSNDSERVFRIVKDEVYRYFTQEPTETEPDIRYIVFTYEKIPPSHQLTLELINKKEMGHTIKENEWPKERVLLHRLSFNQGWFDKHFEVDDDLLNEEIKEKEENYTF